MDAYGILVIILSVTLTIFLVLSIIIIVYILKVVKSVQHMAEKAADAVDSVSNAANSVSKFVTPAAAGKFFVDTVQKVVKNHEKHNKGDR